jgi:predicted esterase
MADAATLHARPSPVTHAAPTGQRALDLGSKRDSYIHVPPQYMPAQPAPLILLLHGAGGHAHQGLGLLQHLADDSGMILVAPASTAQTWDVILNRAFGPDVTLLDQALSQVFADYAVDPSHLAIGGFSDGASYALSVGLANGDLFTHIIAFSPGFIAPLSPRGQPRIFISHGIQDRVLPIEHCSRNIVPQLQGAGYAVTYQEFDDGHTIPPHVAQAATTWFLQR